MNGNDMLEFEEQNFDWLVQNFLEIKPIQEAWGEYIYKAWERYQSESGE